MAIASHREIGTMTKKKVAPLTLHRETLRALTGEKLDLAEGRARPSLTCTSTVCPTCAAC